ncbi:hypothetical protein FOZ63_019838, partial [Perkinsus olseni]
LGYVVGKTVHCDGQDCLLVPVGDPKLQEEFPDEPFTVSCGHVLQDPVIPSTIKQKHGMWVQRYVSELSQKPLRGANQIKKDYQCRLGQRQTIIDRYKPIWEDRRERSREAVNTKAAKYPSQEVKVGDYVLIYKPKKHKLDVCWAGPYKVIDRCGVKVTLK